MVCVYVCVWERERERQREREREREVCVRVFTCVHLCAFLCCMCVRLCACVDGVCVRVCGCVSEEGTLDFTRIPGAENHTILQFFLRENQENKNHFKWEVVERRSRFPEQTVSDWSLWAKPSLTNDERGNE